MFYNRISFASFIRLIISRVKTKFSGFEFKSENGSGSDVGRKCIIRIEKFKYLEWVLWENEKIHELIESDVTGPSIEKELEMLYAKKGVVDGKREHL